ncbi:uroporphyrinogen-III C-methyltransferase [Desulfofundulus thermosubterraneus]|uniref:uroporphyrinogen-III C-methyltransferase n=1 Tax=Desulfofundulus thermosubterraneus DSM 16057 TaxID=1121432 RepID=A0A1M6L736_9FIRM|nr:uroporphyrinogen-III C-methyltransferase [Desulfofundulus thermosubterraneus]SHJ67015.1 uroporphyrinogen III methyltransferase / synthase [Desulfofundulus thermosubterraneus DSM 16057]
MKKGTVYLVGAGPGDPGLITVKGLACIQKADVIVYDRLVSPKLLFHAAPGAERIYVGKSPSGHAMTQEEINQLLVERALKGQVVVRLKGGDPFVFGRGGEEAEALAEASVPFEVVPGITSAVAVPAYAGIPVTHRDCTSTLAVITGNEDPSKESSRINWEKLATGADTLVLLMGMANLESIVQQLVRHGRDPQTPVAVIRWGTRPEQKTVVGILENIVSRAMEAGVTNPAVIIVGEVVTLREKLSWYEKKPLFGKRVLVTRSREQASQLSRAIEALGGEAVEFPTIQIVEPESYEPMDGAIARLDSYRWIIFTSVNGVRFFFSRLLQQGKDVRDLKGANLCAIGPKTKEALERYALKVTHVPDEYRAEQIIAGLKDQIKPGERVLLPRADIARKVLTEMLSGLGAVVDEVVAYRTIPAREDTQLVRQMLAEGKIHIITFTSSSTVRSFVELLKEHQLSRLLQGITVACIGPVTAQTARELGLPVHVQARRYTIEGLVEAVVEAVQGRNQNDQYQ